MLTYAVVILLIGASGGAVLARFVLTGRFAPWGLSLLHAALGVVGFVLVLIAVLGNPFSPPLILAIALLTATALLGLYMASRHYRRMLPAKLLVVTHASFALTFLLVLCGTVFGIL
jgi:hypothetical protein